jgi:predicted HTH domain antitoxin
LEFYAREWKLKKAVELYREGLVTLSRAAEIAEVSVWEIIDILTQKRVTLQYSIEDFEEDLKRI